VKRHNTGYLNQIHLVKQHLWKRRRKRLEVCKIREAEKQAIHSLKYIKGKALSATTEETEGG